MKTPSKLALEEPKDKAQQINLRATHLFIIILLAFSANQSLSQSPAQAGDQESDFFKKTANGSIFIYPAGLDPCSLKPKDKTLLPIGSGFVIGIEEKGTSTPESWHGWKYILTAKHVIDRRNQIYIRVNTVHDQKATCRKLSIRPEGPDQNVVFADPGVDLAALPMPNIPDTDPTVAPSSLLLDQAEMQKYAIGVGTQVLTFGYLYSYSGQSKNFPVTKFGRLSLISDEKWYSNPDSQLMEQGFCLDLSNAPGLSGSPVFTHGIEFDSNPFRYRQLAPYLVGVVKGLMLVPLPNGEMISQGVAVIEPAGNVKTFVREIAARLKASGGDIIDIR